MTDLQLKLEANHQLKPEVSHQLKPEAGHQLKLEAIEELAGQRARFMVLRLLFFKEHKEEVFFRGIDKNISAPQTFWRRARTPAAYVLALHGVGVRHDNPGP